MTLNTLVQEVKDMSLKLLAVDGEVIRLNSDGSQLMLPSDRLTSMRQWLNDVKDERNIYKKWWQRPDEQPFAMSDEQCRKLIQVACSRVAEPTFLSFAECVHFFLVGIMMAHHQLEAHTGAGITLQIKGPFAVTCLGHARLYPRYKTEHFDRPDPHNWFNGRYLSHNQECWMRWWREELSYSIEVPAHPAYPKKNNKKYKGGTSMPLFVSEHFSDPAAETKPRDDLINIYREHAPKKVKEVDNIIAKFKGSDQELLESETVKYLGQQKPKVQQLPCFKHDGKIRLVNGQVTMSGERRDFLFRMIALRAQDTEAEDAQSTGRTGHDLALKLSAEGKHAYDVMGLVRTLVFDTSLLSTSSSGQVISEMMKEKDVKAHMSRFIMQFVDIPPHFDAPPILPWLIKMSLKSDGRVE